jgi:hypothetical protein
MSHSVILPTGSVRQLDRRAEPDEQITQAEVESSEKLSRRLTDMKRVEARLERAWNPRTIDFRDVPVTSGTPVRFEHGFGGRVNWWSVDWQAAGAPNFRRHADTTNDTLVLDVGTTGTVTMRLEEAG